MMGDPRLFQDETLCLRRIRGIKDQTDDRELNQLNVSPQRNSLSSYEWRQDAILKVGKSRYVQL